MCSTTQNKYVVNLTKTVKKWPGHISKDDSYFCYYYKKWLLLLLLLSNLTINLMFYYI